MNKLFLIIVCAYLVVTIFDYMLDYLNYSYLKKHGNVIPKEFQGQIEQEFLTKTRDYTIEKMRFDFVSSIFSEIILLIFIFGGLLNVYNSWIMSYKLPFIASGILFFLPLVYIKTLLSIPFSIYGIFKIENKYGFNNMTYRLWAVDFIKSVVISTCFLFVLLIGALQIITASPNLWWLWIWGFFFIFSIFIMYISPYVLEPLFNKFVPIEDVNLVSDISSMMAKTGIKVSKVLKMDASKRTKHSNAYFTGIGHVKRIVLFDTLLKQMEKNEILAVLAHETGHWKKKHILKYLLAFEILAFISSYISFLILKGDFLCTLFSISGRPENTFFAKIILLSFIASIVTYPITPIANFFSRMFERQADRFACELNGDANALSSSLIKLSKDNLSNIHPHPLYAKFHYSHPPIQERIKYLEEWGTCKNKA